MLKGAIYKQPEVETLYLFCVLFLFLSIEHEFFTVPFRH